MRVLRARLYEAERERQAAEQAATRSAQVGTGARAEKIRTYNYPENRVTDHRIKLTTHRLDQVLQGDLDEFTDALTADEQRRALETPRWTLGEVLAARPTTSRQRGVEHPRRRCRAAARARARPDPARAVHPARPAADAAEREAAREPVQRRGAREPLAYVLGDWGFRRLTLKTDAPRARAPSRDGGRGRPVPGSSSRTASPRVARRRHGQRRDRAVARAGAAGAPVHRDRRVGRRARARTRERAAARPRRRVPRGRPARRRSTGRSSSSSRTRRTSRPASSTRSSPRCAIGSPAGALVDEGQTERARARRTRRARRLARARGARGAGRGVSDLLARRAIRDVGSCTTWPDGAGRGGAGGERRSRQRIAASRRACRCCCRPTRSTASREPGARRRMPTCSTGSRAAPTQPTALLAAGVEALLDRVPELRGKTEAILRALLPGPYTLVLPNPARRYPWLSGERARRDRRPRRRACPSRRRACPRRGRLCARDECERPGRPGSRHPCWTCPSGSGRPVAAELDVGRLPGTPSTVLDLTGPEPRRAPRGCGPRRGRPRAGSRSAPLSH